MARSLAANEAKHGAQARTKGLPALGPGGPWGAGLTAETDQELAAAGRALAHPMRIYILRALGRQGSYCGDLAVWLGLAQSTVSHHLRILREAGLIEGVQQGSATCYRINRERCRAVCRLVRDVLGEEFVQG
ncbi:MAG: helix-turn-helix transcriptional regulator [Firmicutes bacterium]|nr:helix-turn-helix transcriptional regulator [Bacillota bacterium]